MPIYEYQCAACGQVTEAWQKFSDTPLDTCPACGGALCKLISNCAFHLKGSGWYVSDYSGSRPNSAVPESGKDSGDADAGATSGPTTEAAPAAASKIK
jgi:putative FmdB family regulatory protein